jgi:hypothetical protein
MGGNAFKTLKLSRINRGDVPATVAHVVDALNYDGFTYEYAMSALMGSTNKKSSSGDIDFAMNTHVAQFVGETSRPMFDKHEFMKHVYNVLPGTSNHPKGGRYNPRINTQTLKMGNLMSAFPIAGVENNGLVQVDFVFGNYDLLQFTHYSPGDESAFKGVYISQSFGILAKMLHKYYEAFDPETGERTGRVGLHLSLEGGLYCRWESRRRPGMGCSKTTADEFETRFGDAPRFPRIGYITDPDAILQAIFGRNDITHDKLNTFEKIVEYVRVNLPDRFEEFKERFVVSTSGSSIAKQTGYDADGVANHPIWGLNGG